MLRSPETAPTATSSARAAFGWAIALAFSPEASRRRERTTAALVNRAGFALFLLATGDLLFRPADLFPALEGAPIYMLLLAACLALSVPRVLEKLSAEALRQNAISALLLLLIPAVMLSHLAHGNTYDARFGGLEMMKACVFSFLVIALVDTKNKLRALLVAITTAVFATTVLAVAQYHGFIHLAALEAIEQRVAGPEGPTTLSRLCGIGVFNDPNDFSLVLVTAIVVCSYGLGECRDGIVRWLLFVPLGLFMYALFLTHSRGGLLSGVAAFVAYALARLDRRNAALLAGAALVMLLMPLLGRQTNFNLIDPEDSFPTRLRLWSASLNLFYSDPLFGIGQGALVDQIGQVAHNSYLQAFAELGVFGGTAFTGVCFLIVQALWRASPSDRQLSALRPYILSIIVGYAAGLLSLSRTYTVPTQMVFALGTAFLAIVSRSGGAAVPRLDWPCLVRITGVGLGLVLVTHLVVALMIQQGAG